MRVQEIPGSDRVFGGRLILVKPPVKMLWYRGELKTKYLTKTVAIVGSRRMSRYGRSVIEEIVPKLCESGYTIVSGLMYGVDQLAHKVTLESGGVAMAVLGWGIERANDPESDRLADEIVVHGGVVLSEYPSDLRGQLWTFPQRNRIVVGLADYVIVVEAGIKSGTMSTARWAKKMNKPVYAVPGNMFATTSAGANYMVEKGLASVLTPAVLEELTGTSAKNSKLKAHKYNAEQITMNETEREVYSRLKLLGPSSVNELVRGMQVSAGEVVAVLTTLEIRGIVSEERGIFAIV